MLGEFTREDESDRGLNLTGGDGGLLVIGSKLGGLSGNTLENVYDVGISMKSQYDLEARKTYR